MTIPTTAPVDSPPSLSKNANGFNELNIITIERSVLPAHSTVWSGISVCFRARQKL